MEFKERLNRANGRLKAAKIPVRLKQIGERLYARGTFPPPPGSTREAPYQQRIALKQPANPRGLAIAESKAKEIGTRLESGKFSWTDYRGDKAETVKDWVEQFKGKFEGAKVTWRTNYQQPFNKLPSDAPLTAELLRQTLERIKQERPNSRTQLRAYDAYRQLGTMAELPQGFLDGLRGSYSATEVNPRDLPSDRQIAEWRSQIKDEGWQWLYGMLATYGLRPHEAYKVDLADFPTVRVSPDTKTGARFVWPLFPEWAEKWELANRILPPLKKISEYDNGQLGTKTSRFFERLMPCDSYDLRHCYARRCFEFGYSPEFGAKMMGHSPELHCRTYRRWIDEAVYYRVYMQGLNRGDRPTCPDLGEN